MKIGFEIGSMKIHRFEYDDDIQAGEEVLMELGVEFGSDNKNNSVGCKIRIHFFEKDKTLVKLIFSCGFKIDSQSWNDYLNKEKNALQLPLDFLRHIAALTYTTARGVLFMQFHGASRFKMTLPVVNFNEFISEAPEIPVELNHLPEG